MKTTSLFSIILCTVALAACSSDTDSQGAGGEGGTLTTNPTTSSSSGQGGNGTGGDGVGGNGTGGATTSSSSGEGGAGGGSSTCSPAGGTQACVQCVGAENPAAQKLFSGYVQKECACTDGGKCFTQCSETQACVATGSSDVAACQTCFNTIADADECAKTAVATCQADPACAPLLDAIATTCAP